MMKKNIFLLLACTITIPVFSNAAGNDINSEMLRLHSYFKTITDFEYLGTVNNSKMYYSPKSIKKVERDYYPENEVYRVNFKSVGLKNYVIEGLLFDCTTYEYQTFSRLFYYPNGQILPQQYQSLVLTSNYKKLNSKTILNDLYLKVCK